MLLKALAFPDAEVFVLVFAAISVLAGAIAAVGALHMTIKELRAARTTRSLRETLVDGNSPIADDIRLLVLIPVARRWREIARPSRINAYDVGERLASQGLTRVETIYVVEQDSFDPDTLRCSGTVVNAWIQDKDGLRRVRPENMHAGDLREYFWQRMLLRFCILPDDRGVVTNEFHGPTSTVLRFEKLVDVGFWPKWCSWRKPRWDLRTVEKKATEELSPPWHVVV